jgi:hypothetical protein
MARTAPEIPTPMPIFALLPRPLEGLEVGEDVIKVKVLGEEEVEIDVEVGVDIDSDEPDVVDDTPIVAKSVTPSLSSQHVTLTPPQHQDPSLHCPTGTFVVGSPPS